MGLARLIECRPEEKADDDIGQAMVSAERGQQFFSLDGSVWPG